MKKSAIAVLLMVMVFSLVPMGVFADSQSASHHGVTYTSTNVSKITYNKSGCYVTTKASFNWKTAPKAMGGKDVLSHSISSGFLMTSASGSVKMDPVSVKVLVRVKNGRGGGTTYQTISVSNTAALRKYLSDANIRKIRNSGYQQKLNVIEKGNGKTYAMFDSIVTKKGFCKSKNNLNVAVVYEGRSGSYTVKWRTPTANKVYSYNLYTNYAYNSLGLTPTVSFKGWDVAFNKTMVKGNNSVLRIHQK